MTHRKEQRRRRMEDEKGSLNEEPNTRCRAPRRRGAATKSAVVQRPSRLAAVSSLSVVLTILSTINTAPNLLVAAGHNYCGTTYENAATNCWQPCWTGNDSECCFSDQKCYDVVNDSRGVCPAPTYAGTQHNYCGSNWCDAAYNCHTPCPGGLDEECPSGQQCYANTPCHPGASVPGGPINPSPPIGGGTASDYYWCGSDWGQASSQCSIRCRSGLDSDCSWNGKCYADVTTCASVPPNPSPPSPGLYACGYNYEDAVQNCRRACPNGQDMECDFDQYCYADTGCTTAPPGPNPNPPGPTPPPINGSPPTPDARCMDPIVVPDVDAETINNVETRLQGAKNAIESTILVSQNAQGSYYPSNLYEYDDFIYAFRAMYANMYGGKRFYVGDDTTDGWKYGLTNVAAFLAQAMHETIKYDACDENNWQLVNNQYPMSNSCGQQAQSYQDYDCCSGESLYACPVNTDMVATAVTSASYSEPLKCGPKSLYPFSLPNDLGRTDVEGCCWWGRGALQTRGVCAFGKLNYWIGKRANDEGRPSPYPDVDFCQDPEVICRSAGTSANNELIWISGLFTWIHNVQYYKLDGFEYVYELHKLVDNCFSNIDGFIDAVSSIVNRGCASPPCGTLGFPDGIAERRSNFRIALTALGLLPVSPTCTPAPTPTPPPFQGTNPAPNPAPAPTPPTAGGPGNNQNPPSPTPPPGPTPVNPNPGAPGAGETYGDSDSDGIGNTSDQSPFDADADNNGVIDGEQDADSDGFADALDLAPNDADADNDGTVDGQEDYDSDGIVNGADPDPSHADANNNGISDGQEDHDGDGIPNAVDASISDPDSNNDGIVDGQEDTDSDGMINQVDPAPIDQDFNNNGIPDGQEDADSDGIADMADPAPTNPDANSDGTIDGNAPPPAPMPVYTTNTLPPTSVQQGSNAACSSGDLDASSPAAISAIETQLQNRRDQIRSGLLVYQVTQNQTYTSSMYTFDGFVNALRQMYQTGAADKKFYMGNCTAYGHVYGLVNVAMFLTQAIEESIRYDSCDENNWQRVAGFYPLSNACGQEGKNYQDMVCLDDDAHISCDVDPTMTVTAATSALWTNAPPPLMCAPKSSLEFTGYWDSDLGQVVNEAPFSNLGGRSDVESCCWWGRGVLQTKGPCKMGKLNYHLGKRAADEGKSALFPEVDFCADPEAVCRSDSSEELRWVVGMFDWMTSVQTYDRDGFHYQDALHSAVDALIEQKPDLDFRTLVDSVSNVVRHGCHAPPCDTATGRSAGHRSLQEQADLTSNLARRETFVKVLVELGLISPTAADAVDVEDEALDPIWNTNGATTAGGRSSRWFGFVVASAAATFFLGGFL